jgi:hypothetical protein
LSSLSVEEYEDADDDEGFGIHVGLGKMFSSLGDVSLESSQVGNTV